MSQISRIFQLETKFKEFICRSQRLCEKGNKLSQIYSGIFGPAGHRNSNCNCIQCPQKREPAYSQALVQNKIDRQPVRFRESGRQTVRWLWWMVFGVERWREVGKRGQIRMGFVEKQCFKFGVKEPWRDSKV